MTERTEKWSATICAVEDGLVRCRGVFATHPTKDDPQPGFHSSLSPTILAGECEWIGTPKVGDKVKAYSDGTFEHRPATKH